MKREFIHIGQMPADFFDKARAWAARFDHCLILDSHTGAGYSYPGGVEYDWLIAAGTKAVLKSNTNSFEKLKVFYDTHRDWIFGHFSYDLKNQTEELDSLNFDGIGFPELTFFVPEYLLIKKAGRILASIPECDKVKLLTEINELQLPESMPAIPVETRPRIHHAEYIKGVMSLKHHIAIGDIYEANFCQEFYAENAKVNPLVLYQRLTAVSPTPFSAFYRANDRYLMCASPERFLKKSGDKVISQPIKGTIRRSADKAEDKRLKKELSESRKDRSENVMIVDLVRNDLSRTASKGSVQVTDLFGIYTFPNVHQMISTVESRVSADVHPVDVIRYTFPMGSMTGAPKIMAMKLIERYEQTKRGLYSGSVGYITPEGDFDFNVVIRSILYNAADSYLSYSVGGAITYYSDPESEYEETFLKAGPIRQVLSGK